MSSAKRKEPHPSKEVVPPPRQSSSTPSSCTTPTRLRCNSSSSVEYSVPITATSSSSSLVNNRSSVPKTTIWLLTLENRSSSAATPKLRPQVTPKITRKSRIPADPINISIYELRKAGLDWTEIATKTKKKCQLRNEHELTSSAYYSRFVRDTPLVARDRCEPYQKDWYLHMRSRVEFGEVEGWGASSIHKPLRSEVSKKVEAEIVKIVDGEKAQLWTYVAEVVNAKLDSEALTEEEVKAVYDRAKDKDG